MISNRHWEAGCVFDPEVQKRAGTGLGFVHSHLDVALSHSGRRGVDSQFDPDGFVLLEQLRFADLVIKSIPLDVRMSWPRDEKEPLYLISRCFNQLAYELLQLNEPIKIDAKRRVFEALREFDKFSIKQAHIVDAYFEYVQQALNVADQYKAFGILERLYRLQHYHPDSEMRAKVAFLLEYYVKPALNYVGPNGQNESLEELSAHLCERVTANENSWGDLPTSLKPDALDIWLRKYERALLSIT